ncbi:hypothetical protein [Cyclobacterium qasimii]|uniref:Uncharacterized protein n=1 Tax=Cyclobacterium qasimii M12-11B TaxID=641524 RepID=S7VFI5_9BACT|nr:hypothetical protein [Cyclobacterium qasimii]EPR68297.1 hypothetical protein ADICYQ_2767 [Cyclobacterium qasimii M12-11B]
MIRNLIFILLILLIASCGEESKTAIKTPVTETISLLQVPANTIDKSRLNYDNKVSLWTLDGKKFSGYALSYFPDSTLKQKIGILNGKKQNETTDWYPDGRTNIRPFTIWENCMVKRKHGLLVPHTF